MSGKNNIDKLVSDKFASQQLPINEAHWSSTQSFIAAQRRKRKRIVAFWLLGLLLTGSMGYLALSDNQSSSSPELSLNTKNPTPTTFTQVEQNRINNSASTDSTSHLHAAGKSGKSETPIHISGTSGVSLLATISDSSKRDSLPTVNPSEFPLSPGNEVNGSAKTSVSFNLSFNTKQDSNKQHVQEKGTTQPEPDSRQTTLPKSVITSTMAPENDAPIEPKNLSSEAVTGITIQNIPIADSTTYYKPLVTDSDTTIHLVKAPTDSAVNDVEPVAKRLTDHGVMTQNHPERSDSVLLNDSVIVLLIDSTENTLVQEENDSITPLPDSLLLEKKRSLKGFFFMPYFGPSLSLKDLNGENLDLLEKRKNEERNPVTTDIGVTARYGFSNGLYLGSGFNYYKMGENAKYSAFDVVNEKKVPHTYFTYHDTGYLKYTDWDTSFLPFEQKVYTAYEWVTETDSTQVVGEKTVFDTLRVPEKEVNNRFSYIELPLLVGYQIPMGKWTLGGDVGTGINFLVNAQGNYPNLETGAYPSLATSEYRLLSYTFLSNLSLGRELGEHWGLYGNLRFRQQLTSPQKSTDMLHARYRSFGFQFKLNYRF